jgi:hypothetical protein
LRKFVERLEMRQRSSRIRLDAPIRFGKESRRLRIVYEVATHSMCHPNRQLERPVDASDVPAEQEAGHEGIWRVLRAGLMRGQIAVFQQSFVDLLRPPVFCR